MRSNSKNDYINKSMDDKNIININSIDDGNFNVENLNEIKNEEKGIKQNKNEGIALINEEIKNEEEEAEKKTTEAIKKTTETIVGLLCDINKRIDGLEKRISSVEKVLKENGFILP